MRNYIHTQKNSIIQVRYTYSFGFFYYASSKKNIRSEKWKEIERKGNFQWKGNIRLGIVWYL